MLVCECDTRIRKPQVAGASEDESRPRAHLFCFLPHGFPSTVKLRDGYDWEHINLRVAKRNRNNTRPMTAR